MKRISTGIVEDQALFREGVRLLLESYENIEVNFESEDGYSVISKLEQAASVPDIMLVDLSLPDHNGKTYSGLDLTRDLNKRFPEMKVLILSGHNDEFFIAQLIEQGANGYLIKDSDPAEVYEAVLSVYEKGSYINANTLRAIQGRMSGKVKLKSKSALTTREEEVLRLICQQFTDEEIGEKLFISTKTVNGHRSNLLQKTGSKNVTGLVIYAVKNGMVDLI